MRCPRCGRSMIIFTTGAAFCTYHDGGYLKDELEKLMTDRDPLLQEREKTHGSFCTNARISQHIKDYFRIHGTYPTNTTQREALDMIALKLSRILSGQANFKDHWLDIAGYAKLGSEACES
jgi:hypothetical protein